MINKEILLQPEYNFLRENGHLGKHINTMLDDAMKREVNHLQEQKVRMSESEKGPKINVINQYIEESLQYYKETIKRKEDSKKAEWDTLNQVFIKSMI